MANRNRQGVGGMVVLDLDPEDQLHHPRDLRLVGAPVATHGLLDMSGRVLSGCDAGDCARDEEGSAGLTDKECDAGVGADERLLERHRIGRVVGDERGHPVEDRLQSKILTLAGGCGPAPVHHGPEAPFALVDDAVPARCRPRVDS